MNSRGRPRKQRLEKKDLGITEQDVINEVSEPIGPTQEKFPYEKGQICADVKIVEIKPEVERSIGFVYAKRGVIKNDRDKIVNTDGILQGQWRTEINWMTISDFESFVKAQLENGLFVKRGK